MNTLVRHRRIRIGQVDTFYREAGPPDAPVVLLPHGYPCSSYEFRNFMPRLADRWRLVAPDYPGAGYSAAPEDFTHSFDSYADFLDGFVTALGIDRFALLPARLRLAHRSAAGDQGAAAGGGAHHPERRHSL